MYRKKPTHIFTFVSLFILSFLIILGCSKSSSSDACDSNIATIKPGDDAETRIQEAMLDVTSGNQICLDSGTFNITNTLTMDSKTGVTIPALEGMKLYCRMKAKPVVQKAFLSPTPMLLL